MSDKLTTKQAIEQVLKGKRSMRVPDIIKAAVPLTGLSGKTPGQTIYSTLYAENKKADGLFTQVGRGEFKMNPKRKKPAAPKADAPKDDKPKQGSRSRRGRRNLEQQVADAEAAGSTEEQS